MEYSPDQKSELIKSFGKIGFQFIKDVDVIEQYFNKIQNIVRKCLEMLTKLINIHFVILS